MAWDSYQLPITGPLDRLAARSTQRSSAERILVATLADTNHAACRQALVSKFRHLGPTGALTLLHHPPFEPAALFTTEHKMHISGVGQSLKVGPDRGGSKTIRLAGSTPLVRCRGALDQPLGCVSAPQRGGRTSRSGVRAQRCSHCADHQRLPRCDRDWLQAFRAAPGLSVPPTPRSTEAY
jgi:hypothetical protein